MDGFTESRELGINVGDDQTVGQARAVGALDDQAFAAWLAERAGAALLELRASHGYDDPKALKDAGDKLSHDVLLSELARWRPADAVMSEEDSGSRQAWDGGDRPARLDADRVWIIDPLDGTREFSEQGRDDWAVHVALWRRDAGPQGGLAAGAVAMPARSTVLGTDVAAPPAGDGGPVRIAVSRTRPPGFVSQLLTDLQGLAVPMGSAGVKVCSVVTGEVDAYVHGGGQYEWDSAAPVAVALAAGLHASRIDGSPLLYNRTNPRLPDLLVCRPELAERLLAAIAATEGSRSARVGRGGAGAFEGVTGVTPEGVTA
jgi:3'(2'), 5'-bisphosphate nucleotidase